MPGCCVLWCGASACSTFCVLWCGASKIYAGAAIVGIDMLYEAMMDSAQELVDVTGDTAAEV